MRGRPAAPCIVLASLVTCLAFFTLREGDHYGSTEPFVVASAAHIQHRQRLRRLHSANVSTAADGGGALRASSLLRSTVAGSELRWMAIGDSITQAIAPLSQRRRTFRNSHPVEGTCSWLSYLRKELAARGVAASFVGAFDEAAGGPYAESCPKPHPRHSATWGITAEQVSSNKGVRSHFRPSHIAPDGSIRRELSRGLRVYDWVRTYKPHVVSLLLGTNDLNMGATPHQLLDDYLRPIIVQALRGGEDMHALTDGQAGAVATGGGGASDDSAGDTVRHSTNRRGSGGNCTLVVLLFTLLPRVDASVMASVSDFNEIVERRDREWLRDKCIDIVAANEGLNATDKALFYDGLHPTNAGSQLFAKNVMTELNTADVGADAAS